MKGKIERLQGDSWSAGVFAPENPAACSSASKPC